MIDNIHSKNIAEQAAFIRSGDATPVDLVSTYLARIREYDGELKSFVCLSDQALETAEELNRELERGSDRGLLHGIPIAIKDNYLTQDMPTTAGTAADIKFALRDSAVARRLRAAGAILIGKTRTHEFAWGNTTPPTRNPWDLTRIPGGSSGGSGAAVAARLCSAAMGSDTGGSIRIPAALSGVVGLKPTFGLVSRSGIVPHSWSLDHAGPLCATVRDAAILLETLAGYDADDPGSVRTAIPAYSEGLNGQRIAGLRIGVIRNHFFERNQVDVSNSVEAAIDWFRDEGAIIIELNVPNLRYALGAIFAIELSSSTAYHARSIRDGTVDRFSDDVRDLVKLGEFVTGPQLLKAEQFRTVLMKDFRDVLEKCDVILGPTEPITAPPIGADKVETGGQPESSLAATWRLTYPYNLVGLPAITVPCGFDSASLPIGLQLAAKPFDETTLLGVAHHYEQAHVWYRSRPPFPAV